MRTELKTAFRPALESFEARIVATAGVTSAVVHHHAAAHHPAAVQVAPHHAPQVSAASHHKAHAPRHPASPPGGVVVAPPPSQGTPPVHSSPGNTTTNQAWVQLVNMTGRDLEYQIKLAPYADGQFLTFDIAGSGSGSVQYRFSSLIAHGQRVQADFAIQFGNGPVTPLMTGISQQSAQGYYIFLDSNFQYYVSPFVRS